MKQLIAKLIEIVTFNAAALAEPFPTAALVRVRSDSQLASRLRRRVETRAPGHGWRVTSFSGF